jgi:hypothetical protein
VSTSIVITFREKSGPNVDREAEVVAQKGTPAELKAAAVYLAAVEVGMEKFFRDTKNPVFLPEAEEFGRMALEAGEKAEKAEGKK